MEDVPRSLTELLNCWRAGGEIGGESVFRIAYQHLRMCAANLLRCDGLRPAMQPTELVNAAILKLGRPAAPIVNRWQYYGMACINMKRILIDAGRRKRVRARFEGDLQTMLPAASVPDLQESTAVRLAIEALRRHDPLAAEVLWMLKVESRTLREVATAQQRELWRVSRDFKFAVEYLRHRLESPAPRVR